MKQENSIDYPQQVQCVLNKQSGVYTTSLQLKNNGAVPVYFYIISTFGKFMKELSTRRQIDPQETTTLQLVFKSTNIISNKDQQLVIYISESKSALISPSFLTKPCTINLLFQQSFVQDCQIQAIIQQQINHMIAEADQLRIKGSINEAKHLYQQGFQLMRKFHLTLYWMAVCEFILREWSEALRDIEAALILDPKNCHYLFLKAKILQDWFSSPQGWEVQILEQSARLLGNLKKNHLQNFSQQQKIEINNRYQAFQKDCRLNRMSMLKQTLFQQALSNYNESLPICKCYESKEVFEQELKDIIFSQSQSQNITPQQIIDPISYQMMQNPYILPSGYSIDLKNLQLYFKTNGTKDPITRLDIQPNWLFPNNILQSYIKNNPKLKLWMQYEHQIIHS